MKALVQRVVSGSVSVNGEVVSSIGRGIVALIGIHRQVENISATFGGEGVELTDNYNSGFLVQCTVPTTIDKMHVLGGQRCLRVLTRL